MLSAIAHLLIGPAAAAASDLRADVPLLDFPGRQLEWTGRKPIKVHLFNTEADFVEPFFNHLAGDTRSRNQA